MNQEFYNMGIELLHIASCEQKCVEFSYLFFKPLIMVSKDLISFSITNPYDTIFSGNFSIIGEFDGSMKHLQETMGRVGFSMKIKKEVKERYDIYHTPHKEIIHHFVYSYEIKTTEPVNNRFELMEL